MPGTYAKYPATGGGGGGITSINGNTNASQTIVGGTGISVVSSGGTTTITNTGGGGGQYIIDPTSTAPEFQLMDEFLPYNYEAGTNNPIGPLNLVFEGTAAPATPNPSTEKNRIGLVDFTGDSGSQYNGYVSALQPIVFGGATHTMAASFYLPSLPTSTNSYGIQFGFADSFPVYTNSAVIFMNYLNPTWQANTYSNGVGTSYVDTGITVTTGWNNVRVAVNAAGTEVSYYVNGTLGTTITTNIPTAYPVGLFCLVVWYGGATVDVKSDWVQYNYQLATDRGTY